MHVWDGSTAAGLFGDGSKVSMWRGHHLWCHSDSSYQHLSWFAQNLMSEGFLRPFILEWLVPVGKIRF